MTRLRSKGVQLVLVVVALAMLALSGGAPSDHHIGSVEIPLLQAWQ